MCQSSSIVTVRIHGLFITFEERIFRIVFGNFIPNSSFEKFYDNKEKVDERSLYYSIRTLYYRASEHAWIRRANMTPRVRHALSRTIPRAPPLYSNTIFYLFVLFDC